MKFLRETRLIFARNFTRTLRNPMWLIIGMIQPILYLLLFAPLLDGIKIPLFSASSSINQFTPGLLIMIAVTSMTFSGSSLLPDLHDGVVERLRVTPANRLAMLLGMLLVDVAFFLAQCLILIVMATLMGLRADLGGLVILFALLVLVALGLGSFSYAMALIVKDQGTLAAIASSLILPITLLSGVLLPLSLAPKLLQTIADINPFSHTVEAARVLIAGQLGDSSIALAFALMAALALLMLLWVTRVFKQATA
jgi:ABC-2 type transport system permease protein